MISANLPLDGLEISAQFLTGTSLTANLQLDDLRVRSQVYSQDPSTDEFALTARLQFDDLSLVAELGSNSEARFALKANLVLDDLTLSAQLRTATIPVDAPPEIADLIRSGNYLKQPLAGHTVLIELDYLENGEIQTAYFSNNGYTTKANDSEPNRHYLGIVSDDVFITYGFSEPLTVGNLKLGNAGGELDSFMTQRIVQMQSVQIFEGLYSLPRSSFTPVFSGLAKSIRFTDDSAEIVLTDNKEFLNRDLQLDFYGEETPELEGKPTPLLFGECFNVTPVLVDTLPVLVSGDEYVFNNYYEFHVGNQTGMVEIKMRDNGKEYTAPIEFEPRTGSFVAGETPYGTFTGDFKGSDDAELGFSVKLTRVFKDIVQFADLGLAEFDEPSFQKIASRQDPRVGVYLTEKINAVQLLDELLKNIRATWFFNEEGKIELAQLQALTQTSQAITTTQTIREEVAVEETVFEEFGEVVFFDGRTIRGAFDFTVDDSIAARNLGMNCCIEFWFYGTQDLIDIKNMAILGFVSDSSSALWDFDWRVASLGNGKLAIFKGINNQNGYNIFSTAENAIIQNEWNYVKISGDGMFVNGIMNPYGTNFYGFHSNLLQNTAGFRLRIGGAWQYYDFGINNFVDTSSTCRVKQIRITSGTSRTQEPNPPTSPLAPIPYIEESQVTYTNWLPRTITTTEIVTTTFEPEGGEPNLVVESYSILEISLQTHDEYVVCNQVKMGVKKNYTQQDEASLSELLTPQEKKKYKDDYQSYAVVKDDFVAQNYPMAGMKTIDNSYLTNLSQAKNEARAWLDLYKQPRFLMIVKCTGYWVLNGSREIRLGSAIKVNSKRYGTKVGIVTKFTQHFVSGIYELEVLI